MIRQFFKLILPLIFASSINAQNNSGSVISFEPKSVIPTVAFCNLARNPALYEKKLVRVRVSLFSYYHGSMLYDLACNSRDNYLSPEYAVADRGLIGQTLDRFITQQSKKDNAGRAVVTIVGLLNDWNGKGYGNNNSLRLQFVIQRIERVEPVPVNSPWPDSAKRLASSLMDAEQEVRELDQALFISIVRGDTKILNGILATNYTLREENGNARIKIQVMDSIKSIDRGGDINNWDVSVRVYGNTAVVTGIIEQSKGGKDGVKKYRYMNVYGKQQGRWRAIASRVFSIS